MSLGMLVLLGSEAPAEAFSGGINGRSGNPATNNGTFCNACHAGGLAPTASLLGPSLVAPGTTHLYPLRIAGGQQIAGGLDVSARAGTLAISDPGTHLLGGEVTHQAPRFADAAGEVLFSFQWTAPATPATVTLYGAGNSVNRDFDRSGDRATATTLAIDVSPVVTAPGEAAGPELTPLLVTDFDPATEAMSISYGAACGATGHSLYYGPLEAVASYGWSGAACGLDATGIATGIDLGPGSLFFVVVSHDGIREGSYGRSSSGAERPALPGGGCGLVQDVTVTCDQAP